MDIPNQKTFDSLENVEIVLHGAGGPCMHSAFTSSKELEAIRWAGAMNQLIRSLLRPWDERGILNVTIESMQAREEEAEY